MNVEQLIINYLPLANKIAWRKNRVTPKCVTIDELKSAAYMGLVDAANRFNPKLGVSFGLYAGIRISGEISDYLRELKWFNAAKVEPLDITLEVSKEETTLSGEFEKLVTKPLNAIGKRMLKSYYIDGRSMKEIGDEENISESRVSQILKQCRSTIAKQYSKYELYQELAA